MSRAPSLPGPGTPLSAGEPVGGGPSTYALFGLRFDSELPFPTFPALTTDGGAPSPPRLELRPGAAVAGGAGRVLARIRDECGRAALTVRRDGTGTSLRFHGRASFRVDGRFRRVRYRREGAATDEQIRTLFLGLVASLVLNRRGRPVLHACAVEVDGGVAAFLAAATGGKSTLAACFLTQGARLVTDDLLVLRARAARAAALPGPPQLRLWPDAIERFWGGDPDGLPRIGPFTEKRLVAVGADGPGYQPLPLPLRRVYFLERTTAAPRLEPMSAARALPLLVASVYGNFLLPPATLGAQLAFFARILPGLRCRRLLVPDGLEHLPSICALVRSDMGRPLDG